MPKNQSRSGYNSGSTRRMGKKSKKTSYGRKLGRTSHKESGEGSSRRFRGGSRDSERRGSDDYRGSSDRRPSYGSRDGDRRGSSSYRGSSDRRDSRHAGAQRRGSRSSGGRFSRDRDRRGPRTGGSSRPSYGSRDDRRGPSRAGSSDRRGGSKFGSGSRDDRRPRFGGSSDRRPSYGSRDGDRRGRRSGESNFRGASGRGGTPRAGNPRPSAGSGFKTICQNCNKECEVPFRPVRSKPIYCDTCYRKMRNPEHNGLKGNPPKTRFGRKVKKEVRCNDCNAICDLPFTPIKDTPVYCSKCFRRNKQKEKRK